MGHHRVVIAVHEHTMLLELAIAAEVFGVDRSGLSPNGGLVRADGVDARRRARAGGCRASAPAVSRHWPRPTP